MRVSMDSVLSYRMLYPVSSKNPPNVHQTLSLSQVIWVQDICISSIHSIVQHDDCAYADNSLHEKVTNLLYGIQLEGCALAYSSSLGK